MAVREAGDTVVFLHRLEPGGTDRSYGIQVAQLAGLPGRGGGARPGGARDAGGRAPRGARRTAAGARTPGSSPLFAPAAPPHRVLTDLRAMDLDSLTPLEALNRLAELQRRATD